MIDLPYFELQAQQAEICRRQRMERWRQDQPQPKADPAPPEQQPTPRTQDERIPRND